MPALNFKAHFAPAVESGAKRQTIRAVRKDNRQPCRIGDLLTFYTGMRHKNCRKLGEGRCTFLSKIRIGDKAQDITIGDRPLSVDDQQRLASDDGFASIAEMVRFFRTAHGFPFEGWVIKWESD